nr:IclR family transcriptional regulator C-terminal domain-containing protein [Cupriavidus basilensis]
MAHRQSDRLCGGSHRAGNCRGLRRGPAHTRERVPCEAVSVAAPLRDHSGAAVASLSIASPASRTKPDIIERHIALVVERAAMLSRTLGHARG